MKWQPIENAPQEEDVEFLAIDAYDYIGIVQRYYNYRGEKGFIDRDGNDLDAIFWMPLPDPPECPSVVVIGGSQE